MNGKAFAVAFIVTLALAALVYAKTTDQIINSVYDAVSSSLRVVQV